MKKTKLHFKKITLVLPFYLITGLSIFLKKSSILKNKKIILGASIIAVTAMLSACNSGPDDEILCYSVAADSTYHSDTLTKNNTDTIAQVDTIVKNDSIEHMIKCYVPPSYFEETNEIE